jgi:hypothetical protein
MPGSGSILEILSSKVYRCADSVWHDVFRFLFLFCHLSENGEYCFADSRPPVVGVYKSYQAVDSGNFNSGCYDGFETGSLSRHGSMGRQNDGFFFMSQADLF